MSDFFLKKIPILLINLYQNRIFIECMAMCGLEQHVRCTWRAQHSGQPGAQGGNSCLRQVPMPHSTFLIAVSEFLQPEDSSFLF
jgi:hypothetical protein